MRVCWSKNKIYDKRFMHDTRYANIKCCVLFFCHLQATSSPNVALTGTASQSSTFLFDGAERAIDGTRHGLFTCSGTELGFSHWWSLRLPDMYRISSVTITNKDDLFYRMTDVQILIGNFEEDNGNVNPT